MAAMLSCSAWAQERPSDDDENDAVVVAGCVAQVGSGCVTVTDNTTGEVFDIGSAKPQPKVGSAIMALGYRCHDCVVFCTASRPIHVVRYLYTTEFLCRPTPGNSQ